MIRSENIFLPIYPVTPNHITQKGFPAKFCSIFALSARIYRFGRSFYAESDTVIGASIDGFHLIMPP
jgi:hypothetical protein